MKRLFTAFIMLIMTVSIATAQEKGEQYGGISLGYSTSRSTVLLDANTDFIDVETTEIMPGGHKFGIGVEYGYIVAKNFLIFANLEYALGANSTNIISTQLKEYSHNITITPGISYYVRLANNFYYTPRLRAGFAINSVTEKLKNDKVTTMSYGFFGELQPLSVEFRPTSRFAMNVSLCSLSYSNMQSSDTVTEYVNTKYNYSDISFRILGNASVAFKFYF